MDKLKFLVPPGKRIALLFLTMVVGLIATGVISAVCANIFITNNLPVMRILTIVQDIFVFILPAVITAMIVTRQPAKLLMLEHLPSSRLTLGAVLLLLVSTPAMNWIVELNQNVQFPESLASLEATLRTMEDTAAKTVEIMLGPNTPGNLIVSLLIIGVAAGFSEELFFRAGLQRMLTTARMKPWLAIWITAFVFSAFHFQFFGFVPRLLLGALFGYLLVWSGSIWLPMLIHTLNNSMYVVLHQVTGSGDIPSDSSVGSWYVVVASAVATVALLLYMYRHRIQESTTSIGS